MKTIRIPFVFIFRSVLVTALAWFSSPHAWAQTPVVTYAEQGWFAEGIEPLEGRMRHFLNNRPLR